MPRERFTCWSQYTNARYVNEGVRIDFVLVDKDLYEENVKQEGEGFVLLFFYPLKLEKVVQSGSLSLSLSFFLLKTLSCTEAGRIPGQRASKPP